uniref:Transmembrane protein 170A n=1 Tax=Syphacia muris TaxID=451379 RepID=A0A0N5ANU1_9BILA
MCNKIFLWFGSLFYSNITAKSYLQHFILNVLLLDNGLYGSFWDIWLGILLWMTASYLTVYLIAAAISSLALRKHPWFPLFLIPLLVVAFLGPTTFGAATSASIALPLSAAHKAISSVQCMFLGCMQTLSLVLISYTRILATL